MNGIKCLRLRPVSLLVLVAAGCGVLMSVSHAHAQGRAKSNPGVVAANAKPFGKSYGEWSAEWWKWAVGIPAAENPILDETGKFAGVEQDGKVWFLAGNFGGTTERTITVPTGKALFFPIVDYVYWAPDDLATAEMAAEFLGIDPDDLSDEELLRLLADFSLYEPEMTLAVDGVNIHNLEQYRKSSPVFSFEDRDLVDDFGLPLAEDHIAAADGYWIMLAPLSAGEHTIHFTASIDNPLFGPFELDVTYQITVVPGAGRK